MNKIKMFLAGLIFFSVGIFGTQNTFADHNSIVKEAWVARYNGPGNSYDGAHTLAIDSQGNVYVTGGSIGNGTSWDYATVKYDTNGNQLWERRYNASGNGEDTALALVLDSQDNVYVTGSSYGSGTSYNPDYATVKYDSNGNQLWEKRYNGPGNSSDGAYALAIDSQDNVYVAGYSYGNRASYDYATVKYDSNGNQLWEKRYNGSGDGTDYASTLAIDSQDNVYVTGYSQGNQTYFDYVTIKYDSNGNQLWEKRYNGSGNGEDEAYVLAIDSQDNVYVTGYSAGNGTDYDYVTVKYDSNGNSLWEKRYNGSGNGRDYAWAFAIDSQDNVYATGQSAGDGTSWDYVTVKYDTNGNQSWEKRYNGAGSSSDVATALAIDSQDNVYVTGESLGNGTSWDYATIKYDTNGNQLWEKRYNGAGSSSDVAIALAIDSQDNVYVTGWSYWNGTDSDYATIKYLQLPTVSLNLTAAQSNVKLGGELSYDLTLTNNSTESQTINYWAEVKHSNGNIANKFDASSFTLTLDPGEVTTTTVDQAVPRIIPFGQYEYTGNVGETTIESWDSKTFNFTVAKPRVMGWNP